MMVKYIYINEDNVPKQSSTEPTKLDMEMVHDGYLSIYRIESGAGNVTVEETDGKTWSYMPESKMIKCEEDGTSYHG